MRDRIKDKMPGKYQNQIFVLLLLMAAIPLLIAAIISYKVYMEEITNQTDLSMKVIETQVYNDVEVILSSFKQYYLDIASNEEIQWLKNEEDIPYQQYSNVEEAQNLLKGPTYLDEYIGNYAFLNINQGWVLTNNGMYSISKARNQGQVQRLLKIIDENPSTLFWHNNILEPSPFSRGIFQSSTLDITGYQLVMKMSGSEGKKEQLLLVQLNLKKLEQQLEGKLAGYEFCVLGKAGDVLFASDKALGIYCSTNIKALRSDNQPRNEQIEKGSEYRIHIENSGNNNPVYVLAFDLRTMKEGAGKILSVFLILILILTILLIISWILSAILYRPVKNLTEYVSGVKCGKSQGDEFSTIRKHVKNLMDIKDNLQLMVSQQQQMLIEQFLIRSVRGGVTPEAANRAQEQFHLPKVKVYRLLALVCMLEVESGQEDKLEHEALNITIIRHMPQEIRDNLIAVPFHIEEQIMVIIGDETEEKLKEKTMWVYNQLLLYVNRTVGCSAISGISQTFSGLKYLRTAYNECTETLRNTGVCSGTQDNITFYDDIARNDAIIDGYDFVIEKSMTKAVNDGDSEQAAQLVDKFVNSLNNREITWHDRSFFLHRTVVAVISVLTDAGLSANQVFKEQDNDIFLNINYISENDRLKVYLNSEIVQPAISALHEYRFNTSSNILQKILECVNRTQGDITLTECAQEVSYHPSYIWKVLKSEWNMTFTDLTNQAKVNAAKEMLANTNFTVKEIAEKLNYSNTQNFIRFFSKYTNVTPGKYRKDIDC